MINSDFNNNENNLKQSRFLLEFHSPVNLKA